MYAPYVVSSPSSSIVSANSLAWMRSGSPLPYSSAWIWTSAPFGPPYRRGSAHECGSASLS